MTDEQYCSWLMFVTRELMAQRSQGQAAPTDNAGPRCYETNTYTIEDEPFSRWMGWRGEAAQQEECAWPADELKAERQARHMKRFKELEDQNDEFRKFLISLRSGIDRFLEK